MLALIKLTVVSLGLASLAACQSVPTATQPVAKTMEVNGARLAYVEEGQGAPVVLVHGAVSDYRTWDRQRPLLAKGYRTVAYSQRYFGTEPWDSNWPKFGVATHAEDLAAFIRNLNVGPVHLVGWSYGATVALYTTWRNPELVKSAFLYEGAALGAVTDPDLLKRIGADRDAAFGPSAEAVKAGDNAEAARRLIDGVANTKGLFETMPASVQLVVVENARTAPLTFTAPPPAPISCEQMGQINVPVAIVYGDRSRPFFRLAAEEVTRCMPRARHVVVPGANHMWPGIDPQGFADQAARFLAQQ